MLLSKGISTLAFSSHVICQGFQKISITSSTWKCLRRFYSPEPIKRFYAQVDVVQIHPATKDSLGSWGINLDKRQLKTPKNRRFEVDNEAVAHVVASEWARQDKIIQLNSMHMNALANTAIDNPFNKSKFDLCSEILSYLPLDTVLYRHEENERLWELQRELWDPVLYWFQEEFRVKLPVVSGSISAPELPETAVASFRRELMSYKFEAILGLQFAAEAIKSLVLTMGAARQHLTSAQAIRLARLELDFQTTQWGSVEWAHGLENADTSCRFLNGLLFFTLNTYQPFRCTEKIIVTNSESSHTKE